MQSSPVHVEVLHLAQSIQTKQRGYDLEPLAASTDNIESPVIADGGGHLGYCDVTVTSHVGRTHRRAYKTTIEAKTRRHAETS